MDEFELIAQITETLHKHSATTANKESTTGLSLEIDSGDDAAAIGVRAGGTLVWSIDTFTEGVHFRTRWVRPQDLGRRVIAASAADLVAMGAAPRFALVSLACPTNTPPEWVLELADGIGKQAQMLSMGVIGGDVSKATELHITSSVLGEVPQGVKPVQRSGAKPGDVVAIHGALGLAAAGLAIDELDLPTTEHSKLKIAYAYPSLDAYIGAKAAQAGATSMIDVSDGLIADLAHVAKASNVVIDIETTRLHLDADLVHAASQLGLDATELALTGGDDHAIVATFSAEASLPAGFEVVGSVREFTPGGRVLVDGVPYQNAGGYRHF
jgi:thiamine-monophosphate kinase